MKIAVQRPAAKEMTSTKESTSWSSLLGRALEDPGRPLPDHLRTRLEMEFAADFSRVRIHTDSRADQAAKELDAEALTFGQHILFAAGAWRPETPGGWDLLAHEAAHTLQQSPTPSLERARVSQPGEQLEREADDPAARPTPKPEAVIARRVAGMEPRREGAVDPARIVEETARSLMRAIRSDTHDRSGRVRQQLIRMQDRLKRDVLRWLERHLESQEWRQFLERLAEPLPAGLDGVEDQQAAAAAPPTAAETQPAEEAAPAVAEGGEQAPAEAEGQAAPGAETQQAPEAQAAEGEGPVAQPELQGGEATEKGAEPGEAAVAPAEGEAAAEAVPAPPTAMPSAGAEPAAEAAPAAGGAEPLAKEEQEEETQVPGGAAPSESATAPGEAEAAPSQAEESEVEAPAGEAAPAEADEAPESAESSEGGPSETAAPEEVEAPEPTPVPAAAPAPAMTAAPPPPLAPTVPPAPMASAAPAIEEPEPVEAPETAPAPAAGVATPAEGAELAPLGEFSGEPAEADAGGGGGCGGGGGGGGGGGAAAAPAPEAPPEVSQDNPVDAMQSVSTMDAGQAAQAVGGASTAVCGQATAQRERLASQPPSVERPSGSPVGAEGTEPGAVNFTPSGPDPSPMAHAPAGAESSTPALAPPPEPGAPVTQSLAPPRVNGTGQGQLTEADAARVQEAVRNVPVTDESLNVTAGPAPALMLEGDADPAHAQQQQTELMDSAASAQQQGQQDASAPMGENQIYPHTEPGTLTAESSGGGGCGGGGDCGGGQAAEAPDRGTAAIAEEERGDQIRQSAAGAAGDLAAQQQEQANEEQQANEQTQQDVQTAIDDNAHQQTEERRRARQEVAASRQEWVGEQQSAVNTAHQESDTAVGDARRDVQARRTGAERDATEHIQDGNRDITRARQDSEGRARTERANAQREADNSILGWLASAITSFFNRLREAIHAVFEAARRLVRAAIEAAQRLAHEVIDAARRAVVALIQAAGDLLIAIGDRLLAAFPELRERFRNAIQSVVNAAVEAVNRLAELLEQGINALLNALGAVLEGILCLYERAYMAIVDAVATVVQGAINFARTAIAAFGAFAELVGDIAENPGQWIRNLGSSAVDGIRNHLWCALKTAVRNWFNQTVEGIVGLGRMLFDVLRRGGLTMAKIGGFVWKAILSALPMIIITFLIQRLVAMLVPAAAAIMTIIQGLIAAWGTIQQVIQAFQLFFVFLKAVKGGGAGPQFAAALAASAVVVIQFLAMFLLSRIARAAGSVIGRLRAVAQRLMAFFRRAGRAARRGVSAVGRAVARGARAVGRVIARGARAVGRRLVRTRLGRFIRRGYQAGRRRLRDLRARLRRARERRRRQRRRNAQERLNRAMQRLRPQIMAMVRRGSPRLLVSARLFGWRVFYRLSELSLRRSGRRVDIRARVNPTDEVRLSTLDDMTISQAVFQATERFITTNPEVTEAAERIGESPFRETLQAGTAADPVAVAPRVGLPAMVRAFRSQRLAPRTAGATRHMRQGVGSSASQVYEQAPPMGASVSNQLVMPGRSYAEVATTFEELSRTSGQSPATLATVLRTFTRTGHLPAHLQNQRQFFTHLNQLAFIREGVRYTPALAHGAMTVEMMAAGPQMGGLTPAQAFGTATTPGALPMAMTTQPGEQTTPAAARALERRHRNVIERGSARGAGRGARARELARREAALVRQWIRMQLGVQDLVYPSEAEARADIERRVLQLLERYFQTRMVEAGTPG